MTNFKKLLALTLAASTILTNVALAAFTDADEIYATDAVDTLVALDIIKGYEDGSFRPEATVTRAEMAKMIYTIKNGGNDDADAFADISSTFTDISGHWAEGYIKYCQSQGIIAGKSDAIFDPDSAVTGIEALKMTLVLIGYRADKSELVGSNWDVKTLTLSTGLGLTNDYIGTLAANAERQSAAQILYNALYTETVKYSNLYEDYEGTDKLLAETAMNLETISNVYLADSDIDDGISFTTDGTTAHAKSPLDSDKDLTSYIGQKVEILADSKTGEAYGVRSYSSNKVISTSAYNIDVTGSSGSKKATYNSVSISITDENATDILAAEANSQIVIVDNGLEVLVTITDIVTGKVTFVNSDKINVSVIGYNAGQITFDDDVVPSDIAKDDYVQIFENTFTNQAEVTILEKQTGTVEAVKSNEIRIDGVWYTVASSESVPSLSSDIEFYEVDTVIYAIDESDESSFDDHLYVIAAEASTSSFTDNQAKVIFADGTETVVITENDESSKAGMLVSYSEDDGVYTFGDVDSDLSEGSVSGTIFDEDSSKLAGNYVADNALIFVKHSTDEVTVISGAELKLWDDVKAAATSSNVTVYTDVTNGITYVEIALVDLGDDDLPNEAGSDEYGYVTDYVYSTKVDDTVYSVVEVFNGSKTVEIYVEKLADGIDKGSYVTFELLADGTSEDMTEIDGLTIDKVKGYNEALGIILFEGETDESSDDISATITDDTVIIYVDSEDIIGVESGSIEIATDVTGDDIVEDNVYVLVQNDEVVVIFVDVNNNIA